ncbi:amidohydrolase family protein [candidate division KSB1 bacterium]|nr:amidohydrolase family protein [candidate division KSB1 bacterium]
MANEIIDMHIHFGAPRDEQSGCYWSEKFEKTAAYWAMLLLTKSLFKKVDINRVRKNLLDAVNGSKYVHKGVFLAMDQVYDENGGVHPEQTHLHVPNHYLADLAQQNPRVFWGASVHPYRNDWESELDYCLENKAVLCKLIPSSQMFKPDHPKCTRLYQKLAEHNLPLLCHAGPEYAIPTSDETYNTYNNPKYLRTALDNGVTVIIAHCALPYFWVFDTDYHDDYEDFLSLFDDAESHGWNLYADLSAFCTPSRAPYIDEIKRRIPANRLLFGSDYPVPLFELSYNKSKNFFSWLRFIIKIAFTKNPLDKNYKLIEGMKFDNSVFTNASRLFELIRY